MIYPELLGRLNGLAIRVPLLNASLTDCVFEVQRPTTGAEVNGLLRTAESVSPLAAPAVGSSLLAFVIVYFVVYAAGLTYLLRLMVQPPQPGEAGPPSDVPARAAGITNRRSTFNCRSRPCSICRFNCCRSS